MSSGISAHQKKKIRWAIWAILMPIVLCAVLGVLYFWATYSFVDMDVSKAYADDAVDQSANLEQETDQYMLQDGMVFGANTSASSSSVDGLDSSDALDRVDNYVQAYSHGARVDVTLMQDGQTTLSYTGKGQSTQVVPPIDDGVLPNASSATADSQEIDSANGDSASTGEGPYEDYQGDEALLPVDEVQTGGDNQASDATSESGPDIQEDLTGRIVEWGRCSDLLVWACVMRLYESGQIDLDDPIRSELPEGVTLLSGYQSLTMLDLMNHTTGLNVSMASSLSANAQGLSATEALSRYDVRAYTKPGDIVAYSSYDATLAAAIVETITEENIVTYIVDNILDPLGMDDTAVAAGISSSRMKTSSDERMSRIANELTSQNTSNLLGSGLRSDLIGGEGENRGYAIETIDGAALTCVGSVADMIKLATTLVSPRAQDGVFSRAITADEFFETTRTYPALGTRRIAHGMFALSVRPQAVGMTGSASGTTCGIYMDRDRRAVVVVVVDEVARTGLVQGVAGNALGPVMTTLAQVSAQTSSNQSISTEITATPSVAAADWSGVYRDAALPNHGPLKVITALESVVVAEGDDEHTLRISGSVGHLLANDVYVTSEPAGNDPYRFHVGLTQGREFSRSTSDYVFVPWTTLIFEVVFLVGSSIGGLASMGYAIAGLVGFTKSRIRRHRWRGQPACLLLAWATTASLTWTAVALLGDQASYISIVPAICVLNAIYIGIAIILSAWIAVTRWRGTANAKKQLVAALVIVSTAVLVSLNFVYWEVLP